MLALAPAARATKVLSGTAVAGGGEAALQAAEAGVGGEFTPSDVGTAAAFGGTFQLGGKAIQAFKNRSAEKDKIVELINKNPSESVTAKYILEGGETLKKDPVAKSVIRQGMDEGTVALIKGATPKDRQTMLDALNRLKKGRTNKRYAAVNRPGDAVGKTLLNRYKTVERLNKEAGKAVNIAARDLKGQDVSLANPYRDFIDRLTDEGVDFVRNKKGELKGVYDESIFANAKGAQKILNDFIKRSEVETLDGLKAHRLKKIIDDSVEFGKKSQTGITGSAERVLKDLRRGINEELQEISPSYKAANTKFSDTIGALDEFKQAAGPSFNPGAQNQEKMLVNVARSLMSNNQKRTPALNAINDLQDVAKKYGQEFDDDIVAQSAFMAELEALFGSAAPTSFAGGIETGTKKALETMAGRRGLQDIAIEGVSKGVEKARGISEENLIKSLESLLSK
jgi:hypothetical protein